MTAPRLRALALSLCLMTSLVLPLAQVRAIDWTDRVGQGGLQEVGEEAYGEVGSPTTSLGETISMIIRIILGFLGIIFVILIILAGFKYMTAAGNDEKVKEAVKQITNAAIGLLIILSSYAITVFITNVVVPKVTE